MAETAQKKPTRAGFVRGVSLEIPVDEVIRMGKKEGLQIKAADVHAARYYMRKPKETSSTNGRAKNEKPAQRVSGKQAAVQLVTSNNIAASGTAKKRETFSMLSIEQQMILYIRRLGTLRSRELLERVERELLD